MNENDFITLDYGSGGKKTSQLISEMILPLLGAVPGALCDGAVLDIPANAGRLVFSTDSFVVSPYFFPGGDIGKLSVCGTVNDLAMMGAVPKFLSLSFIIEEGMPFADLKKITESIGRTAREAGVQIVTGDTKVVEKGTGDGIYINTTGIGFLEKNPSVITLKPENIRPGDAVIVSGNVGDHGTAVMLARNPGLGFLDADETGASGDGQCGDAEIGSGHNDDRSAMSMSDHSPIKSDCAPLHREALALVHGLGPDLRVMRDPTRGGLATTLNEFIEDRKDIGIELRENDIPVSPAVNAACEMLGLDPLYCACEGRLIAVVAPERAEEAVEILHGMPHGAGAKIIGYVTGESSHPGKLVIRTLLGTGRIVQKLSGAQLPRIC